MYVVVKDHERVDIRCTIYEQIFFLEKNITLMIRNTLPDDSMFLAKNR